MFNPSELLIKICFFLISLRKIACGIFQVEKCVKRVQSSFNFAQKLIAFVQIPNIFTASSEFGSFNMLKVPSGFQRSRPRKSAEGLYVL
jgi:hypothetical protein